MNSTAFIRTISGIIAGAIITLVARYGFDIDQASLIVVLNGIFQSLYYIAVRYIGSHYPNAEWLLGSPATPTYDQPSTPSPLPNP